MNYWPRVFTSFVRRETLRDAFELWMTPLDAAESITGMAAANASFATEASFPSTASRTRLTKVRRVERMCLFLWFFFSFCLNLFRADLWLAKLHLQCMVNSEVIFESNLYSIRCACLSREKHSQWVCANKENIS